MLFKFPWIGTDKVTRLSTINDYENGGLKMIDLESMIKSLRLAWLKRIFRKNDGAWKSYLRVSLQRFGGLFLFYCNYDIKCLSMIQPGRIRQEVIILKSPIWLKLGRKIKCHEHIHVLKHQVKIFYFTRVMGKT